MGIRALCIALIAVFMAPAFAHAGTWTWARDDIKYARKHQLLPTSALKRGPKAAVSRAQLLDSLIRLERYRAQQHGTERQITNIASGHHLKDVGRESTAARAVKLGWMTAPGKKFRRSRRATADDAAQGIVGAMGLTSDARAFSRALRREIPGARTRGLAAASHVMVRSMGLRYNHLSGSEHLEVAGADAMTMAHLAYMVSRAAQLDSWNVDRAARYAQFDLPKMGPNQRKMAKRAVRLIGTPYVWAGNTERDVSAQPQGQGGLDCSGFVRRAFFDAGLAKRVMRPLKSRTSYDQSDIPRRQRIKLMKLRAGDLMFWGYKGTKSKPGENYHSGMYLGNGWFVHSSGGNGGVSIDRADSGYWKDNFAWGRRVLKRR